MPSLGALPVASDDLLPFHRSHIVEPPMPRGSTQTASTRPCGGAPRGIDFAVARACANQYRLIGASASTRDDTLIGGRYSSCCRISEVRGQCNCGHAYTA